jgi:excisionase family DNA binding protein
MSTIVNGQPLRRQSARISTAHHARLDAEARRRVVVEPRALTVISQRDTTRADPDSRLLDVADAAGLLGLARSYVYGMCSRGQLEHLRFGRRVKVPMAALEALMTDARVGTQ